MSRFSMFAELKAKPGKEEDLAKFLASAQALVEAEPGTIAWFAVRFDESTFAVFDTFDTESGRQAHLNGQIAAALHEHAADLLSAAPEIRRAYVLAEKLPLRQS